MIRWVEEDWCIRTKQGESGNDMVGGMRAPLSIKIDGVGKVR